MGYIEDLAAREATRQDANRVRQVDAARVLNQGTGLGLAARGYTPEGLGVVDDRSAQALTAQQVADKVNYAKALEGLAGRGIK